MEIDNDFGRYDLIKFIGQGAFGRVYLAKDKTLDREVAIKILNDDLYDEAEDRFVREVEICVTLRHPNIITIYDGSIERGQAFIAMEYLPAKDLAQLVFDGPLDTDEAVSIVSQLTDALMYLHSQKIIHRDVKPQNVLIKEDGRPILMDFNLGLDLSRTALTRTGMMVGTPQYMAPELVEGVGYSEATEIYALGVLFHNILAGDVTSFLPGAKPLSEANKDLPPQYEEFISWATHPSPGNRCPTMKEFKKRLLRLNKPVNERAKPERQGKTQKAKRKPLDYFVLVCIMGLLIFLISFLGTYKNRPIVKSLEVKLCAFADGCYASLVGLRSGRPNWRILSGAATVKNGKCVAKGNAWIAEVINLQPVQGPKLQFLLGDELLFEQPFELKTSPFRQNPKVRVGQQMVVLEWKLRDNFALLVKGLFKGVKEEALQKTALDKVTLVASDRVRTFDYELLLGNRSLAKSRVALGCVCRRDTEMYPKEVPWKILGKPLVIGKTILAHAKEHGKEHIVALERIHQSVGPQFKFLWQTSVKPHMILQLQDINGRAHLLYLDGREVKLFPLALSARKSLGKEQQIPIGQLKDERLGALSFDLPSKNVHKIRICEGIEDKLHCLVNTETHGLLHYQTINNSVGPATSLGKVTDFFLATANNKAVALLLLERAISVCHLDGGQRIQKLFVVEDGAFLKTIYRNSDTPSVPEIEMSHIKSNIYAIRAGKHLAFYEYQNREMKPVGSRLELPVQTIGRTSRPMLVGRDKVLFIVVSEPEAAVESSVVNAVTVDLHTQELSKKRLTASYVARKKAAACGSVGYYNDRYYVPALEHIHVISQKSGHLVERYLCDWSASYALPVDGTLFVPLKSRQHLGLDLID